MKHWNYVFQILARLQGLNHLIVDLTMAFCSHGCCRLIEELCDIIPDPHFLQPGLRIDVQGQSNDDEMVKVRRAFVVGAKAVASRKNKIISPFGMQSLRRMLRGENDKIEDDKNGADDSAYGSGRVLTRNRKPSMIVKLSIPSMKDKNDSEAVLPGHRKPSMIVKLSMPSMKQKKSVPEE